MTAPAFTFRPIKNECVVVMRGDKVAGTIRRYRAHRACIVRVEGVLTASMALGEGKATFPTITEAKRALLARAKELPVQP
jgi:hypothetical protein